MSKTAAYENTQREIIGVSLGLVVMVTGVSCVAIALKIARSKRPKVKKAAMNDDDDDEIQPYSTRYLTDEDRQSQTNHYYLPADHNIVRHTYIDPNSPEANRREGNADRKDGVQAYLKNKLKLRGPRPGEGYDDAGPVYAKPNRSKNLPVTHKAGRLDTEENTEPEYEVAVPVYAKPNRSKSLPVTPKMGTVETREPGDDYEVAVPVYAKPNRSKSLPLTPMVGRRRQPEGDYKDAVPVYSKPNRPKKPTDNLPATPRLQNREQPDKVPMHTESKKPTMEKANSPAPIYTKPIRPKKSTDNNLSAIDEEDHEYEEPWTYHATNQGKGILKQTYLGMKGGRQWEIEANKDGQQPAKPNIYDKPEVVIGRIQLSGGV
ncbi:hypothetical protein Bbelb_266200 [Branchiostoma belcheri]|nr:hypothetical protein Bbelb_266200 [Branchiostoma belcheri]